MLVANMASAWVSTPRDLRTADGSDPTSAAQLAEHRAALIEAICVLTLEAVLTLNDSSPAGV